MDLVKPKLLLADDSATIRKIVQMSFADQEIDVSTVADGPSAMKKFVEIQPDIVLVDTSLAGTSGYQICEMIKQDEATRHVPVLLLVGSFEPFDQDAAERAGADGFVTKPFTSSRDLVTRVSELLAPPLSVDVATPETADIESLYQKSFDGTQRIEDFETVDEMLIDLGGDIEIARESKSVRESTQVTEPDDLLGPVDDLLGDTGMDDELIEATTSVGSAPSNGREHTGPQPVRTFDWSQEAVIDEIPNLERPMRVLDNVHEEPSDELIDKVAKRVMERLSDQVVREIAQEAVPRITEKLMREALQSEAQN